MEFILSWASLVLFVGLVVGLFSPKTISKLVKKDLSRGKIALIGFGGLILLGVLMDLVEPMSGENSEDAHAPVSIEESTSAANLAVDDEATEALLVEETAPADNTTVSEAERQQQEQLYLVTRVVDGDTFDVNIDGNVKRIRLIGIDTPETVDPRKPVQCFGKEASAKATKLLLNKMVKLEADSSQGELDKYGRLLRYAFREDGLFFNKWMIENGYAYEYTYNSPYKYQQEFKNAQQQAQDSNQGLWADNACPEAAEPVVAPEEAVTAPVAQPALAPEGTDPGAETSENCVVKGNISSDGRKLYHSPGCPSYSRTVIDETAGERWFCTEQDAVNAGWVRAGNC